MFSKSVSFFDIKSTDLSWYLFVNVFHFSKADLIEEEIYKHNQLHYFVKMRLIEKQIKCDTVMHSFHIDTLGISKLIRDRKL